MDIKKLEDGNQLQHKMKLLAQYVEQLNTTNLDQQLGAWGTVLSVETKTQILNLIAGDYNNQISQFQKDFEAL